MLPVRKRAGAGNPKAVMLRVGLLLHRKDRDLVSLRVALVKYILRFTLKLIARDGALCGKSCPAMVSLSVLLCGAASGLYTGNMDMDISCAHFCTMHAATQHGVRRFAFYAGRPGAHYESHPCW